MTHGILGQAFVYLCAAVIFVPVAKRLGLGSVLGYLLAGVAIGPFALGLVGHEGKDVMHFAEFGVVMMLFLVGLELRPQLLWELRKPILGLGGLQVVATTAAIAGVAVALGLPWKVSLAVGMIVAMSSTAIVLSTLGEKGWLKTSGGQAAFSVLLFQDIAVIPILAVFPLLGETTEVATEISRPAWMSLAMTLGAVGAIVLAGRLVIGRIFQFLAAVRLREAFTAFALLIVVGISLLMQAVGLSAALGTFLAGVVLAECEYRHELVSDIEPFKGLLLGLFFISVGAEIDFGLLTEKPLLIGGLVAGSMMIKAIVLAALGSSCKLDRSARWLFAFSLPQIGEFAFVLLSFGVNSKVFGEEIAGPMVATVALSMLLTPLLFIVLERWVLPRVTSDAPAREHDQIAGSDAPVIIAGHGRFGQVVARILRAYRIKTTVLDLDPSMVDLLGRLGVKVYYGDASRLDLLEAAGCEHARLFVLAVDDTEQALEIASTVKKHFPHLPIIARARNRPHYYALRKLGIDAVHRETFGSAYEAGIDALIHLGFRAHTAHRLGKRWRDHEEKTLEGLLPLWGSDDESYFAGARRGLEEAERLMRDEDPTLADAEHGAWNNEALRASRATELAPD